MDGDGVFEDIPRASHFHFDIILSFASLDVEKDPLDELLDVL